MNSRSRVQAALSHEPVDRVPVDFSGHNNTVMHKLAYEELRSHLGLPTEEPQWCEYFGQVVYASEDIMHRYYADCRPVGLSVRDSTGDLQPDGSYHLTNWDGSVWRKPPDGFYYDLWRPVLSGELTSAAIAAIPWPSIPPKHLNALRERARALHEETNYAVVMDGFWIMPVTGTQQWRGFEQWSVDCLTDLGRWEEMIEAYVARLMPLAEAILSAVGEFIDVAYFIGDDLATQNGPWLRPSFYRKHIKPWHRRIVDFIRARTNAKVEFHMCGSIREFIPDLIDIGVDVIDPVQLSAADMDPVKLKRDFGKEIAFWGGVDTQKVLPFGEREEVRQEVRRCLQALGSTGYVFGTCHNIQPGVPPQNVEAMFRAYDQFYDLGGRSG